MPEKYCEIVHNIIFCVQNCTECLAEIELEVVLNEETVNEEYFETTKK